MKPNGKKWPNVEAAKFSSLSRRAPGEIQECPPLPLLSCLIQLETIAELQRGLAIIIKKHTNLAVWLARVASGTDVVNVTSLVWLLVPIAL